MIRSARLHDLGKIALPEHVLLKPGRLTPKEFDVVRKHPAYGKRFLSVSFMPANNFTNKGAVAFAFTFTAEGDVYIHRKSMWLSRWILTGDRW